jgi:hypothetical protein
MNRNFMENKVEEAIQLLNAQLETAERQNELIESLVARIGALETEIALRNLDISYINDIDTKIVKAFSSGAL